MRVIDKFQKSRIFFSYHSDALATEIPRVADVLYVLRLSYENEEYYSNHEVYVANVHLVAAAICHEVTFMQPYDKALARRIIAVAIVDLCPNEARCLLNSAFAEAKLLAGDKVPASTANREALLRACTCLKCWRICQLADFNNEYDGQD